MVCRDCGHDEMWHSPGGCVKGECVCWSVKGECVCLNGPKDKVRFGPAVEPPAAFRQLELPIRERAQWGT